MCNTLWIGPVQVPDFEIWKIIYSTQPYIFNIHSSTVLLRFAQSVMKDISHHQKLVGILANMLNSTLKCKVIGRVESASWTSEYYLFRFQTLVEKNEFALKKIFSKLFFTNVSGKYLPGIWKLIGGTGWVGGWIYAYIWQLITDMQWSYCTGIRIWVFFIL